MSSVVQVSTTVLGAAVGAAIGSAWGEMLFGRYGMLSGRERNWRG